MKSTLFFTVIGLISMAANVQAGSCGCDSTKQYCNMGYCFPKKIGTKACYLNSECWSNKCEKNKCGCTTQNGNTGCSIGYYCASKICDRKKSLDKPCAAHYECDLGKCSGTPKLCRNPYSS
jgi:hypothetical protein